jgi:hypothetical protein
MVMRRRKEYSAAKSFHTAFGCRTVNMDIPDTHEFARI